MSDGGRSLHVFLNYACQAKCGFCYNPELTPELIAWRLPLQKVAETLVREKATAKDSVTFSGGEVTLLKDLPAMLRLAKKAGFGHAGIITNALRLADPAYARELADAGMSFCVVSIHGADAALHDRMLELPGSFEKVLAALSHLRALKMPLILNFVMTKPNHAALAAFVERFGGDPSVVELQAYMPHYEGLMQDNAAALHLTIEEARPSLAAAVAAAKKAGADAKLRIGNVPPCLLPEHRARLFNWRREGGARRLVDPAGMEDGVFQEERRDRVKTDACRRCALEPECLGFEAGYAARHGVESAEPVR
jgi:MoaA/NifB/PqqE/SkfB family radical SAM enzyme